MSGGKVIQVDFGEVAKARRMLRRAHSHALFGADGGVLVMRDGDVVIGVHDPSVHESHYEEVGRFSLDEVLGYLYKQRATEARVARKLRQASCTHEYKANRRCRHCGRERPKKWTRCRQHRLGTHADYKAGRATRVTDASGCRYLLLYQYCARRHGHAGDCRWRTRQPRGVRW